MKFRLGIQLVALSFQSYLFFEDVKRGSLGWALFSLFCVLAAAYCAVNITEDMVTENLNAIEVKSE